MVKLSEKKNCALRVVYLPFHIISIYFLLIFGRLSLPSLSEQANIIRIAYNWLPIYKLKGLP